jgi:hypothetical protein
MTIQLKLSRKQHLLTATPAELRAEARALSKRRKKACHESLPFFFLQWTENELLHQVN